MLYICGTDVVLLYKGEGKGGGVNILEQDVKAQLYYCSYSVTLHVLSAIEISFYF